MSTAKLDSIGPLFFAAAGLLVASGVAKLRDPQPAGRALASLRLPSGDRTVRAIGMIEILVGAWCLSAPGRVSAVSLAVLYSAFATFLAFLMRAHGVTCGCAGKRDTPPSLLHIAMNAAAVATAAVVASAPTPGVLAHLVRSPLLGLPFLFGTGLIGYLAYLMVTYLPGTFWSYDRPAGDARGAVRPRRFALGPMRDR